MRSHILEKYSQSRYGHGSTPHDIHVIQKGKVAEFMIGRLRRLPLCIAENETSPSTSPWRCSPLVQMGINITSGTLAFILPLPYLLYQNEKLEVLET